MRQAIGWCAAAVLLLFSRCAMQSASDAAQVFVQGVLPALFPLMVLSRMLPGVSAAARPSRRDEAAAGLFALLAGSPASAQRVRQLWDAGLSPGRTQRLLALTGVMSPMFFAGTLAGWTDQPAACWLMLAAHWLGAAASAWLWGRGRRAAESAQARPSQPVCRCTLPEAILQSAQAMLAVCGAMMLFSIAAGVGREILGRLFPGLLSEKAFAVLWALLEIGGGARAVLQAWQEPPFALLAGLCSFGGMSLWMQNLLFAGKCIRPVKLLAMRALHGAMGYGICQAFLKIQNLLIT